jgi:hypothetical protein
MDIDQELRVAQAQQQEGRLSKEALLLLARQEEGPVAHALLLLLIKGVDHTRVPVEIEELWRQTGNALYALEGMMKKAYGMLIGAEAECDLG